MAKRCSNCNKKTGIMEHTCKCEEKFCIKCRHPESHKCAYDFKTSGRINLEKRLTKIEPVKIIKI